MKHCKVPSLLAEALEKLRGKKIWCQATVIRYCIVHNLLKVHGYSPEFA